MGSDFNVMRSDFNRFCLCIAALAVGLMSTQASALPSATIELPGTAQFELYDSDLSSRQEPVEEAQDHVEALLQAHAKSLAGTSSKSFPPSWAAAVVPAVLVVSMAIGLYVGFRISVRAIDRPPTTDAPDLRLPREQYSYNSLISQSTFARKSNAGPPMTSTGNGWQRLDAAVPNDGAVPEVPDSNAEKSWKPDHHAEYKPGPDGQKKFMGRVGGCQPARGTPAAPTNFGDASPTTSIQVD